MSEPWDGRPENLERDSEGHVLRVNGQVDVYSWIAARQWFEDQKGRWVAPVDLVKDGDQYYGQIVTPAHAAAAARAEREAIAVEADCACVNRDATIAAAAAGGDNCPARWRLCGHSPCHALQAAAIRARPAPSGADALAAALRQARAEGMRKAAEIANGYNCGLCGMDGKATRAILAAAEAEERGE